MSSPIIAGEREPMLAMTGISKSFGGTVALDDVSFHVRHGTIHALVGENGAGKTTLMRIAFRLIQQDRGTLTIADARVPLRSPADAIAAGLGMVHQHFANVPAMTVGENVALGGRGPFSAETAARRVAAVASRTGLDLDPAAWVADLSVGAQQRLEIVKALSRDARILILDEPTAVLAPREADELLLWLRGFANDGHAVVLITHKLREALAIADEVTVLRRGRVVLSTAAAALTADALAGMLVGPDAESAMSEERSFPLGSVVARLEDVDVIDERGLSALRSVTLDVRGGEILGIAGVEGAGQRELLRLLAGRRTPTRGHVTLPPSSGFIPEDRQRDALILDFSIPENVALRGAGPRRGRTMWRAIRERSREMVQALDVRGASSAHRVGQLSGGNQQKLVLARELAGTSALVVAENPTRGLDIRAGAAVHARLRSAATSGAAVVVYSSDLDEVLALADRVMVMHAGQVTEAALDREMVGRAMLGVS